MKSGDEVRLPVRRSPSYRQISVAGLSVPSAAVVGIILSLAMLTACTVNIKPLAPQYASPSSRTQRLRPLDDTSATGLQELGILVPGTSSGSIETMIVAPSNNKLIVVYRDGYVREWDLETNKEVSAFDVGFVAYQATSFSSDGLRLITPSAIVTKAVESNYDSFPAVEAVNLWDTQAGKQVGCFGFTCDPARKNYASLTRGATLSPNGRWLVEYTDSTLTFQDLYDQLPTTITSLNNPDGHSDRHISRFAFDLSGEYFVVAYAEGPVALYDFDDAVLDGDSWTGALTLGQSDSDHLPAQSLIIDDTRSWLASLRRSRINIWNLRTRSREPFLYEVVSASTTMAFDHSGQFLFIGADSKLMVLNLASESLLAQYEANEISAVAISPDNRLVVWGDTSGTVHIWGAPSP